MSLIGTAVPWLIPGDFAFNITASTTNVDLRTAAIAAGWNQSSPVTCTVNAGVNLQGELGGFGLTIGGSFPGGVTLINNGVIYGKFGRGGNGGYVYFDGTNFIPGSAASGDSGSHGLLANVACKIQNNGVIAGSGGGGGGGGGANAGVVGSAPTGGNGGDGQDYYNAATSGGSGSNLGGGISTGNGGNGGAIGSYGTSGTGGTSGGSPQPGASGGPPGYGVLGNSNITWLSVGTVLGSIS